MKIIPKLGLAEKIDPKIITYTDEKILALTGNAPFANVVPTIGDITAKKGAFEGALAASNISLKNQLRVELEEMLTLQSYDCAKIAAGDLTLYLTSGYEAKNTAGQPTGELDAPENILFRNYGKNSGQLVPDWNTVKDAKNYTAQVFTDITNPDASIIKEETISTSKVTFDGLTSGQKVWVRVRVNGGSTKHSAWSDPATKFVP